MVIIDLKEKVYVLSEDFIEENSMKDFEILKQIQSRNITEIEDIMFKKIKNHEQASQYIIEYSSKLNEFKKKKSPSLQKEIKELDSSISKYFQKMEKKKFELTGKMNNTGIPEFLILDTKEKKIYRKGLFPQPDAILERKK